MELGIFGRAAGLFAVTNIDDILILALFFAQGAGHHGSTCRIVVGRRIATVSRASLQPTSRTRWNASRLGIGQGLQSSALIAAERSALRSSHSHAWSRRPKAAG
ncbi:hypothetical protein ACWCRC_41700, partial [Streptomyces sp. NPDC001940]